MWGLATLTDPERPYGPDNPLKPDKYLGFRVMKAMGVPLIEWPNGHTYFNVAALEIAFTFLSRFGGPGFWAPSAKKRNPNNKSAFRYPREVTPELLKKYGIGVLEDALDTAQLRRGKVTERARLMLKAAGRRLEKRNRGTPQPAAPDRGTPPGAGEAPASGSGQPG
jgi:hypothetical protein